jgi:hypothetical protein
VRESESQRVRELPARLDAVVAGAMFMPDRITVRRYGSEAILHKSISSQIHQLILHISNSEG